MAEQKTLPTKVDPQDFIASLESDKRREQALVLLDLFGRVTNWPSQMWGDSIIGFGRYRYEYKSGRTGEWPVTGFSPRKANLSLYVMSGFDTHKGKLARLGKHKHSVSCLYLTRLDTIDMDVLEEIIADDVARMKDRYPFWPK